MVPPRDGREYPRQSSLFARSGAVSLFVIASNFSGRYPVGDKARNLNKTNQYSNPPLSLADSPSVPFSAFFSRLFFLLPSLLIFIRLYFPPHLRRPRPPSSRPLSRLLRSFIHWYNIEMFIYSRLFAGGIGRSPFQTLSTSVLIGFQ